MLMGGLTSAYPRQTLNAENIEIYGVFLCDLDFDLAKMAVMRHVASSKFFPTIAEIREAAQKNVDTTPGLTEAWGEVSRAISHVGFYGSPEFSHEAITQTVTAIGWQYMCQTELNDMGILRAQFLRLYEAKIKAAREQKVLAPLIKQLLKSMPVKMIQEAASK